MITKLQQDQIVSGLRAIARGNHKTRKSQLRQFQLLLIGAVIALNHSHQEYPPHWQINIACGRVDRIFDEPIKS